MRKTKKLSLNAQTLRLLSSRQLGHVNGGLPPDETTIPVESNECFPTRFNGCWTFSC